MVRLSDLKQLQLALEMYRLDVGSYPLSGADNTVHPFRAGMDDCLSSDPIGHGYGTGITPTTEGYIKGLVSKYISKLPEDPTKSVAFPQRCYAYASNGTDYMVTALNSEGYTPPSNLDRWNTGGNPVAVFTAGARDW